MNKKILITGATGLLGSSLSKQLIIAGNELTIFTRNIENAKLKIKNAKEYVHWDYNNPDEWKKYLNGKYAVVHLAGVNLAAKRWNENFKKEIYNSRIVSTKNIVEAIEQAEVKPKVLITASAVGIYGNRGEELLTEDSKPGNDFLANLCKDWEDVAAKVEEHGVRRVSLRTGIVLSKEGGALKRFLLPFKLFLGGPLGNGKQWFPWIHIDDLAGVIIHALENDSLTGPVNCASPGIVRMKEFAKTLGKVLHRPALFPVPVFALKIIVGEMAEAIAASQYVSVNKLLDSGYKFKYRDLEYALMNLLKKS